MAACYIKHRPSASRLYQHVTAFCRGGNDCAVGFRRHPTPLWPGEPDTGCIPDKLSALLSSPCSDAHDVAQDKPGEGNESV